MGNYWENTRDRRDSGQTSLTGLLLQVNWVIRRALRHGGGWASLIRYLGWSGRKDRGFPLDWLSKMLATSGLWRMTPINRAESQKGLRGACLEFGQGESQLARNCAGECPQSVPAWESLLPWPWKVTQKSVPLRAWLWFCGRDRWAQSREGDVSWKRRQDWGENERKWERGGERARQEKLVQGVKKSGPVTGVCWCPRSPCCY